MLTVAPATSLSDGDLDRHRLAREHRLVDRRLAFDDHAVGRNLLAGPNDEQIADANIGHRNEHLGAVPQDTRLLRTELEQLADRLRGAALGARLEVAAEQDQRRHDGRDLEVRLGGEAADEHDRRPQPGRKRCRARSTCPSSPPRAGRSGAPRDGSRPRSRRRPGSTGRSATHSQPEKLKRRHHRQQRDRDRQHSSDQQSRLVIDGQRLVVMVVPCASSPCSCRVVDRPRNPRARSRRTRPPRSAPRPTPRSRRGRSPARWRS